MKSVYDKYIKHHSYNKVSQIPKFREWRIRARTRERTGSRTGTGSRGTRARRWRVNWTTCWKHSCWYHWGVYHGRTPARWSADSGCGEHSFFPKQFQTFEKDFSAPASPGIPSPTIDIVDDDIIVTDIDDVKSNDDDVTNIHEIISDDVTSDDDDDESDQLPHESNDDDTVQHGENSEEFSGSVRH